VRTAPRLAVNADIVRVKCLTGPTALRMFARNTGALSSSPRQPTYPAFVHAASGKLHGTCVRARAQSAYTCTKKHWQTVAFR